MKVYLGENEIHAIWLSVKVAFVLLVFLVSARLSVSQLVSRSFFRLSFLDILMRVPLMPPPVVIAVCRAGTRKFLAGIIMNYEENQLFLWKKNVMRL